MNIEVRFFKSLWGMTEGPTIEEKVALIAAAGYDGIEFDLPHTVWPEVPPARWSELLAAHNLLYIAQIFPDTADEFDRQLAAATAYRPLKVNSHSGRDKMSTDEAVAFFRRALAAQRREGLSVSHETHRHRVFFSPWSTARVLEAVADLHITADFSHWCVVCESLLDDLGDILHFAADRARHIHGRVGFEQGPQVPDPRAPEYARHLARHEAWWDLILRKACSRGEATMTFTAEFGPPPYLHTVPHTRAPLANLWDINKWMTDRQRTRWGSAP